MRKPPRVVVESLESRRLFAVLTVTNLNDTGAGSLRNAVTAASSGDTINFSAAGTITLTSGAITLDKGLTIVGPGSDVLAISGNNASQVFVTSASGITIEDVSIVQGTYNNGGGAMSIGGGSNVTLNRVDLHDNHVPSSVGAAAYVHNGATLSMFDCTVRDNTARYQGGGILSTGTLNMTRCTLSNNSVHAIAQSGIMGSAGDGQGGALAVFVGTTTLTNCTLAGNSVTADPYQSQVGSAAGGAIYAANSFTTLNLINCTITDNSCNAGNSSGGGVDAVDPTVSIVNTIIAGNTATTEPDIRSNHLTDGGYNIIGAYSGGGLINGTNNNHIGTLVAPIDAGLGALADNGGDTETVALQAGSIAIDAGTSTGAPAADQRGIERAGATDIGAFEFVNLNTAPSFSSTPITDADGEVSYSYSITAIDGEDDDLTITALTKPEWLSLNDNGDGTGSLSGMPGYMQYGANEVTLAVSDGTETFEQTFVINVSVPRAVIKNHTLIVNGTDADDDIHVWIRQDSVRVTVNGAIRNFALSDINAFKAHAFGGDDSVLVNVSTMSASVFGGDGNDRLTGGWGDDSLVGGTGKDLLLGGEGQDRLEGGGGKDRLIGGAASDTLFGQAGNDLLYVRDDSADITSGGADDDSAETDDPADVVTTVETLLA